MEQKKKEMAEMRKRKREEKQEKGNQKKKRPRKQKAHLTKISTKMILPKTQQLQQSFIHNALLKRTVMIMTPGSSVMGATYSTILSVLAMRAGIYRN